MAMNPERQRMLREVVEPEYESFPKPTRVIRVTGANVLALENGNIGDPQSNGVKDTKTPAKASQKRSRASSEKENSPDARYDKRLKRRRPLVLNPRMYSAIIYNMV